MQNDILLGDPEAHEKLTGRLFYRRKGESGYNDAGNCKDYVDGTTRSLVTRARAGNGVRFVNDEQADVCHENYTFLLDEKNAEQEILIRLAIQKPNKVQNSHEGQTATIEEIKLGRWYLIGSYGIENVVVTSSGGEPLEEGADYVLDKANGRIQIPIDANLSNGENLNLTFDQPNIEFQEFESQQNALFYCDFIIEEFNQYHPLWLRQLTFSGYMNITEFPSQTGEFGTYRAKVTPSGAVKVLKRPQGQSIETIEETTEGPGHSSSSQSLSSSSSHSRSSSSTSA